MFILEPGFVLARSQKPGLANGRGSPLVIDEEVFDEVHWLGIAMLATSRVLTTVPLAEHQGLRAGR